MRKEYRRKKIIPPVVVDFAVLQNFINEISHEFEPGTLTFSISVSMPGEELSFQTIEEMKSYDWPGSTVTDLSIHLRDNSADHMRRMYFTQGYWYGNVVNAEGASESWCAGIVDKAKRYFTQYRAWHWFLRPWYTIVLMMLPMFYLMSNFKSLHNVTLTLSTYFASIVILGYLYFAYGKILRPMTIYIRHEDSWVRRHAAELTVVAAIISAISAMYVAVYGR